MASEWVYAGHTVGGADAAGSFSVDFTIHANARHRVLTGLVDTRRLYSIVPAPILEELGVKRADYQRFRRADGFVRQLGIGLARMELQGETAPVHIVFGDDRQETVIGSLTLAVFGLAADPIQERLVRGLMTL